MAVVTRRVFLNRIFICLLYVLGFTLPIFIPNWHNKILILLSVVWVFLPDTKKFMPNTLVLLLLFLSMQIVYIIGLTYSNDFSYGLSIIETFAPSFLVVWIILSSEEVIDGRIQRAVLISFAAGVITLNLASLAFISMDMWDPVNLQSNIILANNHIVHIHPAYVSLYLSFAIFFIIDRYFPVKTHDRKKLGWVMFALVILGSYLVWINSRTGILSFFLAFLFYAFYRFKMRKRAIALSALIIFMGAVHFFTFSHERFITTPLQVLRGEVQGRSFDGNTYPLLNRMQILSCSAELVKGSKILYGYGTGDFRDQLKNCFKEKNYTDPYEMDLDSHNEYFAQLHRHGIIGLSLFMALLIVPFCLALKYRSPLLAVFIILFAVTAMFENVFSAQKGVIFFALFCPLLILYAKGNAKKALDSSLMV
jgi:O-antigen ligase